MRKITIVIGIILSVLICAPSAFAQGKLKLSGIIVDEQNVPILGADIVQKGTTIGTMSGEDGKFFLNVDPNSIIQISMMGFQTIELPATASFTPIVLKEDKQLLSEVVIIGYGTIKKDDLTGSVIAIKTDEINRPAVTSPQQMLQGKVPGVQIIPGDGGPGSQGTIRIRGAASLNASNDPLIVIDGVPLSQSGDPGMSNPLQTLNPNDIASFTVLKDASATAIYGSRASNGVLIITTKKGAGNKLNVSYSGSFSVSHNSKKIDVMSASEYVNYINELYPAGTTIGDFARSKYGNGYTYWQDEIFRTAFSTDHNISIYGNINNRMPYRASIAFVDEQGTLKTSHNNRYTADISINPNFFDNHLTITGNAKGVISNQRYADAGAVNAAAFFDPTQETHFKNADGSIDYTTTNGYWNWINSGSGADVNPNSLAMTSPLSMLYDIENKANTKRFIGNLQVDYKVHRLEDLRVNVNVGLDISNADRDNKTMPGSFQAYKDSQARGYGQYSEGSFLRRNQLLETYINYNHTFNKEHNLDVLGGYSWQHFYSDDRSVSYRNNDNSVVGDISNYPPFKTEHYLISFYGRINYSYKSKYLFTATVREDASSRFSKNNRWGLFPSAALAWNIAKENFIVNSRTISQLKLRVSWGKTGQQEIGSGDYPYLARYLMSSNQFNQYNMGNGGYSYLLTPLAYDPNIKWETTTTYNVGVDFGFFQDRITGTFDAYKRKTDDLLNQVTVPLGSNFSNTVLTNVGNMENKGLELSLNFVPIRKKDINLNIGFNGTWQNIKFTKLTKTDDPNYAVQVGGISKGTGGFLQYHKVGYAPYTFFCYEQIYDASGNPIQNALVDRNDDGIITIEDRYITNKSPNPDFFFGINVKLDYKNWDIGFNAHGQTGNWLFNDFYSSNSTANFATASGYLTNYANVVKKSNFRNVNNIEQNYSDMFLENASFFKLDDINAGYTFRNFKNSTLNMRLGLSISNIFTITKYSGLDPELPGVNGIDNNIWPRPRTFSLRLNINF